VAQAPGNLAISICDGRTVRDLFCNGLLDAIIEAGHRLTIFTEAVNTPEFVNEWKREEIRFRRLLPCRNLKRAKRLMQLRVIAGRKWIPGSRQMLRRLEQRYAMLSRPEYLTALQEDGITGLLATHVHLPREQELVRSATQLRIPTVGLVRSWDNIHKGLRTRTDTLAVWNEINHREAIELEDYTTDEIEIVGAPQFDGYFRQLPTSREEFMKSMRLDPNRPLILFASLGCFDPDMDETCWMEALLNAIDSEEVKGQPQVICRLHPWSNLGHFQRFANRDYVRFSFADKYYPSLGWTMSSEDVADMASMIRHADVVITPGSTVTIEAAIFDRPTVVPMFHPYQPELAESRFRTWVYSKHFKYLLDQKLVHITYDQSDFVGDINRCFDDPSWFAAERETLRETYVPFQDGRATQRLANLLSSVSTPTAELRKTQPTKSLDVPSESSV